MRILKLQHLPPLKEKPWLDRTKILYHAIFQVFEDFITQEYMNENFHIDHTWPIADPPPEEGPTAEWHEYLYAVEDAAWKAKCKEILAFWQEQKKYESPWDRAHSELEHKMEGLELVFDDWLEPADEQGNRKVKDSKEPELYWDTLKEMRDREEFYENKINEYLHEIIDKRRWMWT